MEDRSFHSIGEALCRRMGATAEFFRRSSGLFLPLPSRERARAFSVFEKPGSSYQVELPGSLDGSPVHPSFREYAPVYRSSTSSVYRIPGGIFHGHDHTLFDRHYHTLDWDAPFWAQNLGRPGTLFRARLPKPTKVKGRVLVLSAPGASDNLWHVLFDSLVKLKILEEAAIDLDSFSSIAVNSLGPVYAVEAYRQCGLPMEKLIETDKLSFIQADELVFVTLGYLIPPDRWAIDWLRRKFIPDSIGLPARTERVFISRGQATRRRLLDEEAVFTLLASHGFKKVYFERMSVQEQIAVVQRASAIVAPHGAGLTNIIWCQPGTLIVELHSMEYVPACYWLLTQLVGARYRYAVGTSTLPQIFGHRCVNDLTRLGADIRFPRPDNLADQILAAVDDGEPLPAVKCGGN